MLSFNSQEAYYLNTEIFKLIKNKSYKASEEPVPTNLENLRF